jgi:hypothetical protein
MNQRFRVASAPLFAIPLLLAGCGNQPAGHSHAFGKLSYKGEPAAGALLVFHVDGKPQSGDLVVPSATVEDDGSFNLVSPNGDGAPPGKYKVLVSWPTDSSTVEPPADGKSKTKKRASSGSNRRKNKIDSMAKDRLNGRYFNVDTPLTTIEVKAETTDLGSLEIKD